MDQRLTQILSRIQREVGLETFTLHDWTIRRSRSATQETDYYLTTDWLPYGKSHRQNSDSHPLGTICVDYHFGQDMITSMVIVGDYDERINPPAIEPYRVEAVIQWIERQMGLEEILHFQLEEVENEPQCVSYTFRSCHNGVAIFPTGYIHVRIGTDGRILFFSITGIFNISGKTGVVTPVEPTIQDFHLTAHQQLQLIEFPDDTTEDWLKMYGINEVFLDIRDTGIHTYELFDLRESGAFLNQPIRWRKTTNRALQPFSGTPIDPTPSMEASLHQAFSNEPHPDLQRITREDQEKSIKSVTGYFRSYRDADESNQWKMTYLYRDHGLLVMEVIPRHGERSLFKKYLFFLDPNDYTIVNKLDTSEFSDMWEKYDTADEVFVTTEQAFELLKNDLILHPYYVFDLHDRVFLMKWKLDCNYVIDAKTGNKVNLRELAEE